MKIRIFATHPVTMNSFRRVLSYAQPLRRYWPGYLLLSILSVVFGVVNYGLLGPLLTVLFDNEAAAAACTRPEFSLTIDYFTGSFRWLEEFADPETKAE